MLIADAVHDNTIADNVARLEVPHLAHLRCDVRY